MNTNNFGIIRGRLTADPVVFDNKDGSCKVKFTIAAENNYKTDGKREAQMIPVETYVKEYAKSPYASIHKGDKITAEYSLRNNNYEKDGQKIYSTIAFVESITFEESKAVTEARAAERAAQATAPATAQA